MRKYDHKALSRELLSFIGRSPSAFHATAELAAMLKKGGFEELKENRPWSLTDGRGYYVKRNDSSIVAFRFKEDFKGFQIAAAHSDSPTFKIKDKGELNGDYLRLNTEKYGGMICYSWLDRPLSVAGRVTVADKNGISTRLLDIDRDLLLIPSVPIHMNRAVNDGMKWNPASDTLPLYSAGGEKGRWNALIARELGVEEKDVLGADLYLYPRTPGCVWGEDGQYISSRALDDLQCAFSCVKGLLAAKNCKSMPIAAIFDNEEVGSSTRQGAASTFLHDVLRRICPDEERYQCALASSFLLSCDNAHAVHPNHPEYSDPENKSFVNRGVVLKYNAAQKYTTDGVSGGYVKYLCAKKGIPLQTYANRSDIGGGSTLGNIAVTRVPVCSADVGLPQFAMHSAYESAGAYDTAAMVELCRALFEGRFIMRDGGYDL